MDILLEYGVGWNSFMIIYNGFYQVAAPAEETETKPKEEPKPVMGTYRVKVAV